MMVYTKKMHRILWLADIAAAGTAALRHLGNTPRGYGGQVARGRQNHKIVPREAIRLGVWWMGKSQRGK